MKKVLVVDDEKSIVKGIKFSLEQDDMSVDTAYDGETAIEKIRHESYDVVLLDVMLPDEDGYSILRRIRNDSRLKELLYDDGKKTGIIISVLFILAGGAAFACRHAFSDLLAPGRPNEADLKAAEAFVLKAAGRAEELAETGEVLQVPGDAAAAYYVPKGTDGQPAKFLKAKPLTNMKKCTKCGYCVTLCPVASIDPKDVTNVPGVCIKCQACVKICPVHAKYFDDPVMLSHIRMLEEHYSRRAENELFL